MWSKRLHYIDFLESISILAVIYCHFIGTAGTSLISNVTMQFTTTFAVPIFFMANGALLFLGKYDLKKHLKKIALLFVASVAWKACYLIFYLLKNHFFLPGLTWIGVFRYFCGDLLLDPYVPAEHFWFIYALLKVYILFPLLKVCFDAGKEKLLLCLAGFLLVSEFLYTDYNALSALVSELLGISHYSLSTLKNSIGPFTDGSYLLFFLLGPFLHRAFFHTQTSRRTKLFLSGGALGAFLLLLLEKYLQTGTLVGGWVRLDGDYQRTGTLILTACIFSLAATLSFPSDRRNRFWAFISLRTMNIYSIHMLLCALFEQYLLPHIPYANAGIHLLRSVLVLAVSILLTEPITYVPVARTLLGLKPFHQLGKERKK